MNQTDRMRDNGHAGGKYLRSGQASRKRQAAKRRRRRRFGKFIVLALILLIATMAIVRGFRGREKEEVPETEPETTIAATEAVTTSPETTVPEPEHPTPVRPAPAEDPYDSNDLLSLENHMSTVVAPSVDGCTALPYRRWREGDIIAGNAPDPDLVGDNLDDYNCVTIQYEPDCTIKSASYNVWTHAVTYKNAALSDVQRKSTIIVYGEYDSDNILHADKVYILDRLM